MVVYSPLVYLLPPLSMSADTFLAAGHIYLSHEFTLKANQYTETFLVGGVCTLITIHSEVC